MCYSQGTRGGEAFFWLGTPRREVFASHVFGCREKFSSYTFSEVGRAGGVKGISGCLLGRERAKGGQVSCCTLDRPRYLYCSFGILGSFVPFLLCVFVPFAPTGSSCGASPQCTSKTFVSKEGISAALKIDF